MLSKIRLVVRLPGFARFIGLGSMALHDVPPPPPFQRQKRKKEGPKASLQAESRPLRPGRRALTAATSEALPRLRKQLLTWAFGAWGESQADAFLKTTNREGSAWGAAARSEVELSASQSCSAHLPPTTISVSLGGVSFGNVSFGGRLPPWVCKRNRGRLRPAFTKGCATNCGRASNSLMAFFRAATAAARLSRVESLGLKGRPGSRNANKEQQAPGSTPPARGFLAVAAWCRFARIPASFRGSPDSARLGARRGRRRAWGALAIAAGRVGRFARPSESDERPADSANAGFERPAFPKTLMS